MARKNKDSGFGVFATIMTVLIFLSLVCYLIQAAVDWVVNHKALFCLLLVLIVVGCLRIKQPPADNASDQEPPVDNTPQWPSIYEMSGADYEQYVAYVLSANGYTDVRVTQTSGDFGVDVIACKDSDRYAVQCKKYRSKVGNSAVQEVVAGMRYYNCDRAMVITNSTFTPAARTLAKANDVILVDRLYPK